MKRGGPLKRRAPLGVSRSPQPRRRKPLPPVSAKRKAENEIRWRAKADYLATHLHCEMCGKPFSHYLQPDIHERLSRARGGSITDPNNFVALCRPCHSHITRHPAWAEANGWALKSGANA